jgi:hypothetical protein
MKSDQRQRQQCAKYARLIRRNKRRDLRVRRFEDLREERRAARAAGLPIRNSGPISRVELAPQIRIDNLRPQIKILLKAFGHPEALVTDESLVWDMLWDGKKLVAIRRKLKIPIATNDYIFSVAERLRARVEGRK